MRYSLANVATVAGLFLYCTFHTVGLLYALTGLDPEIAQFQATSHRLSNLFGFLVVFLLPLAFLFSAVGYKLVGTCIVLPFIALLVGVATGIAARMTDPYGTVTRRFSFVASSVLFGGSTILVSFVWPKYLVLYAGLSFFGWLIATSIIIGLINACAAPDRASAQR
jgi:hypothetical protein